MKMSKKGLDLIKHYEGFRADAYLCPANVWTIGYGTTSGVRKGQKINESQAFMYLAADVAKFEQEVEKRVKVPLTQTQFDALVSFVYNVGPGNFASSTLLKLLNSYRYDEVPAQMMRWNKGGGKVLSGLTKRRTSEGVPWSTGKLDV